MQLDPKAWWFQLVSNVVTPIILILLGMILPAIARRDKNKVEEPVTKYDEQNVSLFMDGEKYPIV